MEAISLSRMQSAPAKQTDQAISNCQDCTEDTTGFDQHLNQQIDQVKPEQSTDKVENTEQKQVHSEDSEVLEETVEVPVEAISVAAELTLESKVEFTELDETVPTMASQAVEAPLKNNLPVPNVLTTAATETAVLQQQSLPLDGKSLPPEAPIISPVLSAKAEVPVAAQGAQTSLAPSANMTGPQPSASRVSNAIIHEAGTMDDLPIEALATDIKPQGKTNPLDQLATQSVQARAGSAVASTASAASLLQQVPLTTSTSAIHLPNTNPLAETSINPMPTLSSSIATPVQSPGWSQSLAERVAWMVNGNFQNAEIKLNPANLGPMQIKMSLQDDQASVSFISQHAPVREALEAAMPRLREMLEQQGISLTDANVSQFSAQTGGQAEASAEQNGQGAADGMTESELAEAASGNMNESRVQVDQQNGLSIFA